MSVQTKTKWLAVTEEIYEDQPKRVKKLRAEGRQVIGYFDAQTPVELITAAGLIPYRMRGNVKQPPTQADAHLERITCSFVLSCFEMALRGQYDFLDGVVIPHTCDHMTKIYNIWWYDFRPKFSYFVNLPHTTSEPSMAFFRADLNNFKKHLEEFTGKPITDRHIAEAIKLHNKNRALMREVYNLRKPDPPLISAAEMTKILVASMSLPVEEANKYLAGIIPEIKERRDGPKVAGARLMVHGSGIDDTPVFDLIEGCGANVVIDDVDIGTRTYWYDVATEGDLLGNLAKRYLDDFKTPRTYRDRTGSREEDLQNRFGHILSFAKEFNVNGVVLYITRYCDNFEFDVPDLKDFLQKAGYPVFHVEDEYIMVSPGRLKTQIDAFLETIKGV